MNATLDQLKSVDLAVTRVNDQLRGRQVVGVEVFGTGTVLLTLDNGDIVRLRVARF